MPKKITCPECGEDLLPAQIPGHLNAHWGKLPPDAAHFPQASERYLFLKNAAAREE